MVKDSLDADSHGPNRDSGDGDSLGPNFSSDRSDTTEFAPAFDSSVLFNIFENEM
jgi:hypothetical protein